MTLQELKEEIKLAYGVLNSRDFFFSAVIVLVGFASFGLGRLSLLESKREPMRVENALMAGVGVASESDEKKENIALGLPAVPAHAGQAGGQIVASKTGAKYHFPWCAGASQIAEKNKIWFDSVEEAQKAGYAPASNCKGLK
ncbi:MAG: hypothetical protein A3C08_01200 [Candidatus Taylorbacteria bacterium RIFCSPHIGHO2_02_FULL_47_18]|uniref:Ada DNA repair metal-binding domain-containing protein n=1 Tax=Candidatus Taylorbacteria bacterium RIFCSPLOWO2_01_FULL_48_100 TaxID=1802322 RepID=A0A1G2NFC9_9BACT|nr:MAG: hypothetical protein A2670_02520 [Candidatus Taylorbacteria bacterium RIFCSPHIGHO2_01_FULL_48_38]OHA28145.1 MAG: hypothetical protein A3C08_01200 [Candidatus Taylorbacteria bacterium RIFCSPHIGHO2_02_FULL_47_18]OHA34149.1 MAG: hypothetical protein A2938_02475 [Candidatus Taylorbacteria bacterium RIFCSPLOWO2_01_FULL_48_100]OHA40512.1 MAG: hypothetical protein A3J31_00155 [Candidatus Taylorbacteria bacterium RIFCSPLOWO2_02_FULL_48_16]OHA45604.1 MAG: hypothetical protein A3H13_00585 [Candid